MHYMCSPRLFYLVLPQIIPPLFPSASERPSDEFDPVPERSDPDGQMCDSDFLLHSLRPNVAPFSFLTHKEQTDMPISIFKHASLLIPLCAFSFVPWMLLEFPSNTRFIFAFWMLGNLGLSTSFTSKCFSNI